MAKIISFATMYLSAIHLGTLPITGLISDFKSIKCSIKLIAFISYIVFAMHFFQI